MTSEAKSIEAVAEKPSSKGEQHSKGMSRRSIIVTLTSAVITSIVFATIGYGGVKDVSQWLADMVIPVEPCMLIATVSAVAGCVGYLVQQKCFPVKM